MQLIIMSMQHSADRVHVWYNLRGTVRVCVIVCSELEVRISSPI
jgi:hypothetical protein